MSDTTGVVFKLWNISPDAPILMSNQEILLQWADGRRHVNWQAAAVKGCFFSFCFSHRDFYRSDCTSEVIPIAFVTVWFNRPVFPLTFVTVWFNRPVFPLTKDACMLQTTWQTFYAWATTITGIKNERHDLRHQYWSHVRSLHYSIKKTKILLKILSNYKW